MKVTSVKTTKLSFSIVLLAVLLISALSSGSAFAGSPGKDGGPTKGDTVPASQDAILYSQFDNFSNDSGAKSLYVHGNYSYRTQAADDFVIPAGQTWTINQVEIQVEFNFTQTSLAPVNVYFYLDAGGVPGTTFYSQSYIGASSGNHDPHVVIPLPSPPSLFAGHWWVSVQGNWYSDNLGSWRWVNRVQGIHHSAQWITDEDAGWWECRDIWYFRFQCLGQPNSTDEVFLLRGQAAGGPTSTPTRTATRTPTRTPSRTPTRTRTPGGPTATPTSPPSCAIEFSDVPQGSTFYDYVHCLACRNIMNGYQDGTFRPNAIITRGQVAKVVSKAAGYSDTITQQHFQDVQPGSTYYTFVERMNVHGVMNGYVCGGAGEPCVAPGNLSYFRPGVNVSRGQMAKVIAIAAGLGAPLPGQRTFEDVPQGSTFWEWIEPLAGTGAIGGYACGGAGEPCVPPGNRPYYRPANEVTRGQASKIITTIFFPECLTP